jgi:hypothetical protein
MMTTNCGECSKCKSNEKCYLSDCNLGDIAFENYEKAGGPMYVAQLALKCFAEDANNTSGDCYNAFRVFVWIGSLEASIDELVRISPWASKFILSALWKYETKLPFESNIILNFGDAVNSLQYQLRDDLPIKECLDNVCEPCFWCNRGLCRASDGGPCSDCERWVSRRMTNL